MDLYILRHGIAVDRGDPGAASDFDRALTKDGKKKMEKLASGMKQVGVSVERVLTSPAIRALQTAEIAARALGDPPLEKAEIFYQGDSHSIRAALRAYRRYSSLMIVGHEPTLSELAALWISGDPGLPIDLKKAGLILLEVSSWREEDRATLKWLLPPRILEALG